MGRVLALDVGTVRIGVAVTDPLGFFAQGVTVLAAEGPWMDELRKYVKQYDVERLLIGLPRRTDGSEGPEAVRMREIVEELRLQFKDLVLEMWDERFTTTIAQQTLIEGDVSRKKRKGQVDKVAAVLLLQNYLEHKRG